VSSAPADPIEVGADGTVFLRLHVQPGASRAGLRGRHGGALKVKVTAPAEGGRANEAVLLLIAELLDLPRSGVSLVSGPSSRAKRVAVTGIDEAGIRDRLGLVALSRP